MGYALERVPFRSRATRGRFGFLTTWVIQRRRERPRPPERGASTGSVDLRSFALGETRVYKGDAIFRGAACDGLHERLVSPERWYRVQNVLARPSGLLEKTQNHDHYLKGTIYCDNCGSRLMITHAKNHHGDVQSYFICAGRYSKRTNCTRASLGATGTMNDEMRQVLAERRDLIEGRASALLVWRRAWRTAAMSSWSRAARPAHRGRRSPLPAARVPRLAYRGRGRLVRPGQSSPGRLRGPDWQCTCHLCEPR